MQTGIRVLGQRLARHAHNRGRRSVDLKTANIAAPALNAARRSYAGVTKFTSGAISATPKFSVEYYSATDTGPEREAKDRLMAASRAPPHLAERGSIRIVLEQHGSAQRSLQCRR